MHPSTRQFTLPDLASVCPLEARTNPHYKEAAAESKAWVNSYNIFTDRKREFFILGAAELLCSYSYPYAGYEQFRTSCDFVNLLFVLDEYSDDQNGVDARATGKVFVNAMKYPDWDDGSKIAKMSKEFRERFVPLAGPNNVRRFQALCEDFTRCVAREAELRERGEVLTLEDYIPLRRQNSGVPLCLGLVEYVLGIDLPDAVFENQDFMDAFWAVVDFVCWSNDIYSYDMEQSKGLAGNNITAVLMEEKDLTLQDASDYVGLECQSQIQRYLTAKSRLSSSNKLPSDVLKYVDAIGCWISGNLAWSFETPRYFGADHQQVKETLVVNLRLPERVLDLVTDGSDDSGFESDGDGQVLETVHSSTRFIEHFQ
ncbi:hypothetical protein NMY22_g14362 [Coprinellus aureogranulatus]|nr:hypothetical protein NMY22_g14362 [Coprinellus aureogranulatus]